MSRRSFTENSKKNNMNFQNLSYRPEDTHHSSYGDTISQEFDCLKISILNKASRLSSDFEQDRPTLGPNSNFDDIVAADNEKKNETISPKPTTNSQTYTPPLKNNFKFSMKKILLLNETQRREQVKKTVDQKKQEMEKSRKLFQKELSKILSDIAIQRERETAKLLCQLEAEEEELAQKLEIERKNEIQRQRVEESNEILKKILPFRENLHAKWKDIGTVSKACQDKHSASTLLTQYASQLKDLHAQMETIIDKAKVGDLTPGDISMAEIIAQCNDNVFQSFKADIDQIDALYEKEMAQRELKLREAELVAQEEAQRIENIQKAELAEIAQNQQVQNIQNQPISEVDSANSTVQASTVSEKVSPATNEASPKQTTSNITGYPALESLEQYMDNQQFLVDYSVSYANFVQSNQTKKFKFECQKSINQSVNALSHRSREDLVDKYEKLKAFLSGRGTPNISGNPEAENYCKYLLAYKIVEQRDNSLFKTDSGSTFGLAALVLAIWNDWPDFGTLLLAQLKTKCPFFIDPVFLLTKPDEGDIYRQLLGFKVTDTGQLEKFDDYVTRIRGMMYLYAAIMVTRQRGNVNKPHPHGLGHAWRWLAAALNTEPTCDSAEMFAALIYTLLEVSGNDLWKTYPHQFPKMLLVLRNVFYQKMNSLDIPCKAYVTKLGDLLEGAVKTGSLPAPKGQLPPNFW